MIWKKKTEVEVEFTEEDYEAEKLKEKIRMYKRRIDSLVSDHNQQKVDDIQFKKEEGQILDEVEEDINKYGFDDMMGNPVEYLKEIFNVEKRDTD